MTHGRGSEDRRKFHLSDEQIEAIARRAAELAAKPAADIALEKVYSEVGKGVVRRIAWAVGIGALMLLGWLIKKGHIPL